MKTKVMIVALLMFAATAYGEKVLELDIDVYKDDTVKVNSVKISEGYATLLIPEGKYRLEILDAKGNVLQTVPIDPSFIVFTDPPIERDHATIALRLAYSEDMLALKLYNGQKEIYSGPITPCNNDGICEKGAETYLSCPRDCPLDKPDGICIGGADGLCDPDCASGIDPDCNAPIKTEQCNNDGICESYAGETAGNCPEDCSSIQGECVKEGESIDTSGTRQCCAGLSAIGCGRPDDFGKCPDALCDGFPCAKCGNGACGKGENRCNCPADCVIASSTTIDNGENPTTLPVTTSSLRAGGSGGATDYSGLQPYAFGALLLLIIAAYVIYKRQNKE